MPSFHPCHQSGEDQIPGATHRFCERCPSRRHEYAFDQHRRPAVQHFAEHGKMNERVIMLLNSVERTGARRSGQLQFVRQWRLAPAAQAGRWPEPQIL